MRQVHAHRRGFDQQRIEPGSRVRLEQAGHYTQGMIRRVPHAEHPAVAGKGADAVLDLIGQRLKGELVVGQSQSAGDGLCKARGSRFGQEGVDGLLKTALEQVRVPSVGDMARRGGAEPLRHVKAIDGIEKGHGPHALKQVGARAPEGIQRGALAHQGVQ